MELRKLFIETTNRSIIVIEDIDCSLDLTGKRKKKSKKEEEESSKVTLSGLLNFIDGLWSACGGERLMVFTTNDRENLDPALIRRGRMDIHIEMAYCCFEAFKVLAKNYLDVDSHPLFDSVRELMEKVNITPAEVAENLIPKSVDEDANACLENLIQVMSKAKEAEEASKQTHANAEEIVEGEKSGAKRRKHPNKLQAVETRRRKGRRVE